MSSVTLTDNTATVGTINLFWTNADEQANHYSWRIYQRSPGRPWISVYEAFTAAPSYTLDTSAWANGVTQEFVAVAVTQDPGTGALTLAPFIGASSVTPTGDTNYTLVHPTQPAKTVKLAIVTEESYENEDEHQVIQLLGDNEGNGGGYKINRGYKFARIGSLSAQIIDHPTYGTAATQLALLEAVQADADEMFLRDPFGTLIKIFVGAISVDRRPGVGTMEAAEVSFTYTQIV